MSIYDDVREKVSIYDVIRDYLGEDYPRDTPWQIACPFHLEHIHGDAMKSARIYPESNSIACFAYHGLIDSVEIVSRTQSISRPQAAAELARKYEIEYVQPDYAKDWAGLRTRSRAVSSYMDAYEAFTTFCKSQPGWWPACIPYHETCTSELLDIFSARWPEPSIPYEEAKQWLDKSKTFMTTMCRNYGAFADASHFQPIEDGRDPEDPGMADGS